jgi:hypothetical protein
MEKKKMSYVQPQTETVKIQMEQCIASPQNSLTDMGGNSIYDESF